MNFEDRVLPELREALAAFPSIKLPRDLEMARKLAFPQPAKSGGVVVTKRTFPGPARELLAKVYAPEEKLGAKWPGVLWIHGGGLVLGHPDMDDAICERFVKEARCVVVSVDYRLAPEHPYPAAVEDCYAGLRWMATSAEQLNIDSHRIAVAGVSAGGGLAAAVALMARDKGGPALAFQLLLSPMLDDRNATPSSYEIIADKAVWNRSNNLAAWSMYLGENASKEVSPYAAPARAANFSGLPAAYISVGQLEVFRDESMTYAASLAQAGVPVEFHLYPGCFHGFDTIAPEAEISRRASSEYVSALVRALNPDRT